MIDLLIEYGIPALKWAFAGLGALLASYVFAHLKEGYIRSIAQRAWIEIQGAVLEVSQTFVEALKLASADGSLTAAEQAEAKAKAIKVAKENIGKKGLARLARVLGVDIDRWLGSKVEQAVSMLKVPAGEAPLPTFDPSADAVTVTSKPSPRRPA